MASGSVAPAAVAGRGGGVLRLPPVIEFGRGARSLVPRLVAAHGRRALAVVDPVLESSAGFREVLVALAESGVEVAVHSAVQPEVPTESIRVVADAARDAQPDVVLGWGGGSALDTAKLIALLLAHGGELPDYYGENAIPGPVLPVVAVPTTAGTGSEVTPVAVVSDAARELKVGISSPHLIPAAAVVDPELTVAAPPSVTAFAGIDALAHAVESYTAAVLAPTATDARPVFTGRNALGDPLSLEAARLIGGALETAVARPDDVSARESMSLGSLLAGMAFGPTGTHLSHALQYPIGAATHTPHGLGTGLMLPYVMAACADAVPERLARVGEALGAGPDPDAAVRRVAAIGHAIGVPGSLREIGIERADLPRIAELGLASQRLVTIAPIPVDGPVLEEILERAWRGELAEGTR